MTAIVLAAMIGLSSPDSTAKVSTYGGVLTSWKPAGSSEVMAMARDYESCGRSAEIHGGFPVCWPWAPFNGPETAAVHYISRCFDWRVKRQAGDSVVLELDDNAETRQIWNHRFHLEMEYRIGKELAVEFRATNTGNEPFSCTELMHPYFRVGDTAKCRVTGTDGLAYFVRSEAQYGYGRKWQGDFKPSEVFKKSGPGYVFAENEGAHVHRLVDESLGREIEVEYRNNPKLVFWNSGPNFSACDASEDPEFGRKFLCVEGGALYEECAYTLKPGETHVLSATVRVR